MTDDIKDLSIRELLGVGEYRIPIYQRNYAWGIGEVTQLIQDVADYAKEFNNNNYYIGNLIVFPRYVDNNLIYETIDGQQRTTTLTIIMCALKKKFDLSWYSKVNISFDHREKSNNTLRLLFSANDEMSFPDDVNTAITSVYNKVMSITESICKEKGLRINDFVDYLLNKVKILRISVPKDTNLNHYFEIMNSRGEQLEQHEIIKARLMSAIRDDSGDMYAFNMIWEACSNMDRYVQTSFRKDLRDVIFDDYGTGNLNVSDFDSLAEELSCGCGGDDMEKSLLRIFNEHEAKVPYIKPWSNNKGDEELPDTYASLVTFPNFLLLVLKIMYPKDSDIVLDDKRLVRIFGTVTDRYCKSDADKTKFSKSFIMALLEIRCLFDKYIIKRKQEKWSLKQLCPQPGNNAKYYYKDTFSDSDGDDSKGHNRNIILLLSMFHVSSLAQIYKHWMYAALKFVYHEGEVSAKAYSDFLWSMGKAYMLDIYLPGDGFKRSFEDLDRNGWKPKNDVSRIDWSNINIDSVSVVGESVQNFVFNFYDYVLCKENNDSDFYFGYRTSVEHFYPQHPSGREALTFEYLHSFGNLCLVSRSMNSKFTNNLPEAKYANFGSSEELQTYSMKLKSMMHFVRDYDHWDTDDIIEAEKYAKNLIIKVLC